MRRNAAFVRLFDGYVRNNRLTLLVCTLLLMVGVCGGGMYCVFLASKGELASGIGELGVLRDKLFSREVFAASLINSFQLALLIWLCGLGRFGIAMAPTLLMAKGFACSFSVAALISMYGVMGLAAAAAAILPQMLVMLITAEVFCVAAINQARYCARLADRAERQRRFVSYCIFCMLLLCSFVVCSLYESYASPLIMVWILGL